MLALTFAWVLRRPEFVPPLLIAAMILLGDLMFHRPPGLWAALVLVTAETLRVRDIREGPDGAIWFLSVDRGALFRMTPG
jgi:hypothetical protein